MKYIIDCDPGHDDAIALMLAVLSGKIPLCGVTTVAGNASIGHTTENARKILAFCSAGDIPVYTGHSRPLSRPLLNRSGERVHGKDGLSGVTIDAVLPPLPEEHAVDFIVRTLQGQREKTTLICLGPLTNIADTLQKAPEAAKRVDKLVIMGGAVDAPGNVTEYSEFNFYVDSEAAEIVIGSGIPTYLLPLDVTMKALFYEEEIAQLGRSASKYARLAADLLTQYANNYREELGYFACPLHDALCIAVLLDPLLVKFKTRRLHITTSGAAHGMCEETADGSPVFCGVNIDRKRFVSLLVNILNAVK
ncbi:MAG: nucleoside hydrolase [Christensenellaceae bacterium]|jgi:purine nucleosidase